MSFGTHNGQFGPATAIMTSSHWLLARPPRPSEMRATAVTEQIRPWRTAAPRPRHRRPQGRRKDPTRALATKEAMTEAIRVNGNRARGSDAFRSRCLDRRHMLRRQWTVTTLRKPQRPDPIRVTVQQIAKEARGTRLPVATPPLICGMFPLGRHFSLRNQSFRCFLRLRRPVPRPSLHSRRVSLAPS